MKPNVRDDELGEFCRREQLRLIGLLSLYVGDRVIAEELSQDAFVRVCQHWERVRGMANRRAWLNRVALNLASSWFRRRAAERRARAKREVRSPPPVQTDESERVIAADQIRRAVSSLPDRQRTALILRFYEDMSVAEAAAFMGCAEGTVRALTHQAKNNLTQRDGPLLAEGTTYG